MVVPAAPDPRLVPDRERVGGWFVRIEGTDQSYIDADPTWLEFDYAQRIAATLDLIAPPGGRLRVVHVGGAGMMLARYVAATRPASPQIVFEPDASLTAAVRQVAPLPRHSGIKVRPLDGVSGLRELPADYAECLIVDAFAGAQVPAELSTREWFEDCARVLESTGTLIMNLTDEAPFTYARRVTAGIAEHFAPVATATESATLKGRRFGNLVISAGPRVNPYELDRAAARAMFPYRVLSGTPLQRWLGLAEPYTTADAEPSPYPPRGPLTWR